jgi:hypothetical protein
MTNSILLAIAGLASFWAASGTLHGGDAGLAALFCGNGAVCFALSLRARARAVQRPLA